MKKRGRRHCSGCGGEYGVRANAATPPEKPLCPPCRQRSARGQEKRQGWGWPVFRYRIKRRKGKPTIIERV